MEKFLWKAFQNRKPVVIIYKTKEEVLSKRKIFILKIEKKHLTAYCYLRQQSRTFLRENILAATPVSQFSTYNRSS
ncbi:MAG: hypothetical protein ACQEUT_05180 [Bacillota bacterium]